MGDHMKVVTTVHEYIMNSSFSVALSFDLFRVSIVRGGLSWWTLLQKKSCGVRWMADHAISPSYCTLSFKCLDQLEYGCYWLNKRMTTICLISAYMLVKYALEIDYIYSQLN